MRLSWLSIASVLSLAALSGIIALWSRSCRFMDTVSFNTAWGRRGEMWVQRDLTLRSRLGSLMIVRRGRTWDSPDPQSREPRLLERHELAIFGGDIWSAVGQFSIGRRGGARPPTKRSEPPLTFQISWIEFPLWLPAASCLVLPFWWAGFMVRRFRRSWSVHRMEAVSSGRLSWRGWRAAALGAALVLVVLAAGAAGLPNVAAAIGLPAAAIALIVLTDLPQAWRARGR